MQKRPLGDPAVHISKESQHDRNLLVGLKHLSREHHVSTEDYPNMVVTRGARTKEESEVPKQARRRGQNSQAQNVSHTNMEPKINTNRKLRVRLKITLIRVNRRTDEARNRVRVELQKKPDSDTGT